MTLPLTHIGRHTVRTIPVPTTVQTDTARNVTLITPQYFGNDLMITIRHIIAVKIRALE